MSTISDLRLVTLLPTENQTIYAFNTANVNEYYAESFFARQGTTWAFCVVPDRSENADDYWVNIVQSDNQTVTLNTIIPDIAVEEELRAGILNYYSTNLSNRYTYTIGYQNIRVFSTAVEKTNLDIEYKFLDVEQVPHQLILLISETGSVYSYGVSLPTNTAWKAIMIVEPGYSPGQMTISVDGAEAELLEKMAIASGTVSNDLLISATKATEEYTSGTIKIGLLDTSDVKYSNADGYIDIGVGTEVSKDTEIIMLYTKDKIEGDCVQLGTDPNKLLYAVVGTSDDPKASRLVYSTNTQNKFILKSVNGYYNFDYILGYSQALIDSSITPIQYKNLATAINIRGFGFCSKTAPVNDLTKGYWFLIIDPPSNDNWTYIKIMMFDSNKKKIFSMIAYKDYFEEISEGQFIGQLMYKQESKDGINDNAYLLLKTRFDNSNTISIGVCIL